MSERLRIIPNKKCPKLESLDFRIKERSMWLHERRLFGKKKLRAQIDELKEQKSELLGRFEAGECPGVVEETYLFRPGNYYVVGGAECGVDVLKRENNELEMSLDLYRDTFGEPEP